MIRGIEGNPIFREDSDRQKFLYRLGQLSDATGARVLVEMEERGERFPR
jgi:hypothetical protein